MNIFADSYGIEQINSEFVPPSTVDQQNLDIEEADDSLQCEEALLDAFGPK